MTKLRKIISDSLGRFPKIKSKKTTTEAAETAKTTQKHRTKSSWKSKAERKLERTPATDTVEIGNTKPSVQKTRNKTKTTKPSIGDIFTESKRELAKQYLNDLEDIAQIIPEMTFFRELNSETAVKKITSIIEKLAKREDKYFERGYTEVIRDEIRARAFIPYANKNYQKIVDAMEKKGYRVAETCAEDSEGNLIRDARGKVKKVPDIDVRFGDKAQPSGYQDVQIRFIKGKTLYELILMPGPHYLSAANKEHDIYDLFKKYDSSGITRDIGAKQIVEAIKKEFGNVTKKLYDVAEQRDRLGSAKTAETVSFTEEQIKILQGLFTSLKKLFFGKFNTMPPSKRSATEFKDTKTAQNLNNIEESLQEFIKLYKPTENIHE